MKENRMIGVVVEPIQMIDTMSAVLFMVRLYGSERSIPSKGK